MPYLLKKMLIVPLVAVVFATVLAITPPDGPDIPVLSELQSEPADAHVYLRATNIFFVKCYWHPLRLEEVCRNVRHYIPKPHWHIWQDVCKVVAVSAITPAAKIVNTALRFIGQGAAIVASVVTRVCETVERIIWASS